MVVIDHLDEWGELRSMSDRLLAHRLLHAARIVLNARYDAVTVRVLAGAIVVRLQNYRFLTRKTALEKDDDLSRFQAEVWSEAEL